ncbi:titin-like protein [Lates japonicus]|uniref:Titin-like protein n=1 Tax=Lates japonicus TaxID=270547 RepID=A0AAD3RF75_LATJO|nr:titin-like protein [Lates japonicus]
MEQSDLIRSRNFLSAHMKLEQSGGCKQEMRSVTLKSTEKMWNYCYHCLLAHPVPTEQAVDISIQEEELRRRSSKRIHSVRPRQRENAL